MYMKTTFTIILLFAFFLFCSKDLSSVHEKEPIVPADTIWEKVSSYPESYVYNLAVNSMDYIFAGSMGGIYLSKDYGLSWDLVNPIGTTSVISINPYTNYIYIAGFFLMNGWIQYSTDNGINWKSPSLFPNGNCIKCYVFSPYKIIFAGSVFLDESWGGVYYSQDDGNKWEKTSLDLDISVFSLMLTNNHTLLAGTLQLENSVTFGEIYRSVDRGKTWQKVTTGIKYYVQCFAMDTNSNIFAGALGSGIYSSSNDGVSWEFVGLDSHYVESILIDKYDNLFVTSCTEFGNLNLGVFCSSDLGTTWQRIELGLPEPRVWRFSIDSEGYLYAGTYGYGLYRSRKKSIELIN